jgi:RNA polymerase sigma factor (sigma-70 family)
VSPALREMFGWMPDSCSLVSYRAVAAFSSITCRVILILVALQARSIEVLAPVANNSNCDALDFKNRKPQVLQLLNHLDAAYNLARWLTHNEHDAEDIVQDSYLRAIRHFGGFQGGEGKAWLLAIVRNRCYDSMRQKVIHERTTPFDEQLHNVSQTTLDPEASLLQKERAALLRQALAELPLELREVLVLRELEQLSYAEIAAIAKIPIGTVMSRLSRARTRLQQVLVAPVKGIEDDPQHTSAAAY